MIVTVSKIEKTNKMTMMFISATLKGEEAIFFLRAKNSMEIKISK
ncbi:MAG: hypothetical protein ACOX2F_08195 [bacterium]